MNKVRFLSFAFFLLFFGQCFGQQTKWGPRQKDALAVWSGVANLSSENLITVDGSYNLGYSKGPSSDHFLTVYNQDLKIVRKVPIEFKIGREVLLHQFVIKSKRDYYVFVSSKDKKNDFNTLYYQKIDHQTLNPVGGLKKVFDSKNRSWQHNGRMSYRISPDSSKILVYSNPYLMVDDPEEFDFVVFDPEMNPIWSRKATLPYKESMNRINDAVVDNNGNVFVMDEEGYRDERYSEGYQPTVSNHILFAFSQDSKITTEHLLDPGEKQLVEMKFHFNANGELICAGFSADSTTDFVSGSYFVKIDTKTKEVTYAKESNFGLEKPLYQYSFKQIISKGEDGYILLGEYYEFGMYSVNNGNSSSTKIKYSFGNILIVDIDNAGNVRWKTEIPKFQSSTNNQGIYSSFGAMAFDDHIKIIYNDHIDNFTENARKTGPKKNVSIKKNKGVVVQANVSFDGKVTQKKLFTFDELDVILFPKMFLRIDAENMLMYGGGKGATQFGIMTF